MIVLSPEPSVVRTTRVYQFITHGGLAFEGWVRICQVFSQRPSSDVGLIQVANSRECGVVVLKQSIRWGRVR